MNVELLLALQLASTLPLVGLIWTVQIVQYPLFQLVGPSFQAVHREHARRISWVVGPLMLIELTAAVAWAFGPGRRDTSGWVGLALVGVIWTSTVLLLMPMHRRLAERYDRRVTGRLVALNWIRTVAWTARGVLLIALLFVSS